MRIFCTRIIREKTYRELLKFKKEFKEDLIKELRKNKLPIVLDKTLEDKNITLSRGCVLVYSSIVDSKIDYKCKDPMKVFHHNLIQGCAFMKQKK